MIETNKRHGYYLVIYGIFHLVIGRSKVRIPQLLQLHVEASESKILNSRLLQLAPRASGADIKPSDERCVLLFLSLETEEVNHCDVGSLNMTSDNFHAREFSI